MSDSEGFVKFRQKLVEKILANTFDQVFPIGAKGYNTILDGLLQLNSIFIEGRKTRIFIDLERAIYLSRTKSPYIAEQILSQAVREIIPKEDKILHLKSRYAKGLILEGQNKIEDALIELIGVIMQVSNMIKQSSSKSILKREYHLYAFASYYYIASCYKQKRWFDEAIKYCKMGFELFEQHLGHFEADSSFRSIYAELANLENDTEECIARNMRIKRKFKELRVEPPPQLEPRKNTDYKDVEIIRVPDFVAQVEHKTKSSLDTSSKRQLNSLIDPKIGIKMRNWQLYEFYKPSAPLKLLDEFSLEHDKKTADMRALGYHITESKFAPYKQHLRKRSKLGSERQSLLTASNTFSKSTNANAYSTYLQQSKLSRLSKVSERSPVFRSKRVMSAKQRPASAHPI